VQTQPDILILRPRRVGTLAMVVLLGLLTAAFVVLAIVLHGLLWLLVLAAGCALAVVGVAALPGRNYLRLDREGFDIRTPFRSRRFAWADVTPFVAVRLSSGEQVVFRSRVAPGAALPPAPEPTAEDIGEGADALPATYGRDAAALAGLMNDWRARGLSA
jgi:hypothetical protein